VNFYFVRHGQSQNNLLWAQSDSYDGRVADPELTATGKQQAKRVARFMAAPDSAATFVREGVRSFRITHIYTSLMERAVATGHEIAEALDLPLLTWIDIHETGGLFLYDEETDVRTSESGHSRSYLLEHYPRLILPDTVTEAGWWNRPFESKEERAPRARKVLSELVQRHGESDDGVVFVSHGGFFNYLLRAIFGLPERAPDKDFDDVWFAANNTSITHIVFNSDQRVLTYLNRTDFLPVDLLT
jgi:2,3-bisphosphoglycerate-dependent phosphoglycerate mutase